MADDRRGRLAALALLAARQWQAGLRTPAVLHLLQRLPRARQGIAFTVYQPLDFENQLHIAAAIEPLAGSAFVGLQLRKLGLPEAQHIRFQPADTGYIANLEIEAVGD